MLILADLHLGKITHFRKAGIAVPKEAEKDNFDRFSFLLLNYDINEVLILGDLFHSHYNLEWENFIDFLKKFKDLSFHLVLGNHDILSEQNYVVDNLKVYKNHTIDPFFFTHEPHSTPGLYNMCGHIHPSIKMEGKGLQRLRLPCFHFMENQAILPAFGTFTGTFQVSPDEKDDVFVTAERTIIKVL